MAQIEIMNFGWAALYFVIFGGAHLQNLMKIVENYKYAIFEGSLNSRRFAFELDIGMVQFNNTHYAIYDILNTKWFLIF